MRPEQQGTCRRPEPGGLTPPRLFAFFSGVQVPVSKNPQAERPAYDRSIPTSEHIQTDKRRLEAFHWQRAFTPGLDPQIARFHRRQAAILRRKRVASYQHPNLPIKTALIAFLSEMHRQGLSRKSKSLFPFNWQRFCDAAQREIQSTTRAHAHAFNLRRQ